MVKQRHQLFVTLLATSDAVVILTAALAARALRGPLHDGIWPSSLDEIREGPAHFSIVAFAIAWMWLFGLYSPRRDRSLWSETAQVIKASLAAVGTLIVTLWLLGDSLISNSPTALELLKIQLGALAVLLPVLVGLHRTVFRLALRSIRRRGWNLRHVAIIGTGRLGQITLRTLERNSWTGINVAYFVGHHDTSHRKQCLGKPVLGGLSELEHLLESRRVDAVYLAIPNARAAIVSGVIRTLERFAVDVRIIPDVPPRYQTQTMNLSELDGMPILSLRESPLYGLGGFTKRALDIAGSAIGLLLLSPFLGCIALAVRLSGPGPVVFKQRRVSLGGEEFNIYKFRTMAHVDDEPQATTGPEAARSRHEVPADWTRRNDPRITPIGSILRRTSLDELPQLLNVLKGEMSLVGPRPERPELIRRFRDDWRGYMLRQHVKAGMTGWAQVNGLRGQTSLKKRLQYDLFYIRHWSIWFDLRILWLTLFRGFVHRNAH